MRLWQLMVAVLVAMFMVLAGLKVLSEQAKTSTVRVECGKPKDDLARALCQGLRQ